ncbi:alkaline phosphatase D family protein [Aliiglaciecola sp. LCG003]|uniref:alkaline phosphatase D family protein n=1 Tax=Aliiglaciecola sp. LCG003 TaxID=3053655 RepID=UPI002574811F|nr:alkaline phosphatase D family protein [Aliiglaciecola sp. LCG003]WJG09608.1 alkaline phosphatase D family protein [Aliiglaciecola sp. LCG003]
MKKSLLCALLLLTLNANATTQKILFGSCAHQDKDMPILDRINAEQADLFVFLGDNIYADTRDMQLLASKYRKLDQNPRFSKLKKQTPLIAIWDDHDFGENDAGKEYPHKEASRQLMLDFWQEPEESPRRTRPDGIYTSYIYGADDQSVQVIMPDLRWNRDELNSVGWFENSTKRLPQNMGPYKPSDKKNASMLGEAQWQWLEAELKKPAKIKIIASSLQLLADFTGWEAWANFPQDRKRLLDFIQQNKINGVIIVSGDTHWGEISKLEQGMDYPIWEVTSSGLTEEWKAVSPNQHRVGDFTHSVNYGILNIDWQQPDPSIEFGLKNAQGDFVMRQQILLSSIRPY